MKSWSFRILLTVIFIRPFVSTYTLKRLDLGLLFLFTAAFILFLTAKKKTLSFKLTDKFVFIFLTGILLSCFLTPNISKNLSYIYRYLPFILFFYLGSVSNSTEKKLIILTLITSSLFLFLYSLHGFFTISGYLSQELSQIQDSNSFALSFISQNRAFYPFMSPNLLGIYAVMLFSLSSGVILETLKNKAKIFPLSLSLISWGLSLYVLFLTKSLTAWLALGIITCFFFLYIHKFKTAALLFISGCICAFILIFIIRSNTELTHLSPFYSIQARLDYWKDTIQIIKNYPLTGIGPANFSLGKSLSSHNSYLQIWAEFGLLSFLAFSGLLIIFCQKIHRTLKKKPQNYLFIGLALAGTAFLIDNLGSFSLLMPQTAFLGWLILGLSLSPES
jgi:O-antigen ligase